MPIYPPGKDRKYILVTSDWSGLGFALNKVQRHGEKHKGLVLIAYKPDGSTLETLKEEPKKVPQYQSTGKGLIDTIPLVDLMKKRQQFKDWYWIWDGNHGEEENTLLRKEGFKVFGGLAFAQRCEKDRDFTIKLMESLGLATPEHKEFKSVQEGIAYLQANPDKSYVYKPNDADSSLTVVPDNDMPHEANEELQQLIQSLGINDFVLQEKVRGVEVNVEYICMNGKPIVAHANFECKRRSNGDLGKALGCAMDVDFEVPMDCRLVQMTVAKLEPLIKKLNYTGFADLNVIIGDEGAYFLETCWRFGFNSHPNFFTTISRQEAFSTCADLLDGIYGTKLEKGDMIRKGFGASITLQSDCPYKDLPMKVPDKIKENVYFFDGKKGKDGIVQTGWSNDIAIVTAFDYTIESAFEKCIENCEKVQFINKDFRSDGNKTNYPLSPIKRYTALKAMGLI